MKTHKHLSIVLSLVLAAVLMTLLNYGNLPAVNADSVGNLQGRILVESATAHTADFNTSGYSLYGYGSVMVQVTQVLSDSSDSVTYTPYFSIDTTCPGTTNNWFIGYDTVFIANTPYITSTTYPTGTNPVTTTYYYANTSVTDVNRIRKSQSFSITGSDTEGYLLDTNGAWCMKLSGDLTAGRTATTTIVVSAVDVNQ